MSVISETFFLYGYGDPDSKVLTLKICWAVIVHMSMINIHFGLGKLEVVFFSFQCHNEKLYFNLAPLELGIFTLELRIGPLELPVRP